MEPLIKTDEPLLPLAVDEKIFLGLWLFYNVVLAVAPLLGGFFGAYLVYGSDVERFGLLPWITLIMVGILLAWLVMTHLNELVLRRIMAPQHVMLREVVSPIIGLVVLAFVSDCVP